MTGYGFDEKEHNFWRTCLKYILKKQPEQILEENGERYYLLKDLVFEKIHKTMRAGNICRILIFEQNESIDSILQQEINQLKLEEEGPVQSGICYYLTNLNPQNSKDREKQEQLEQGLTEQTSGAFRREYWNRDCIYPLIQSLKEEMDCYTSYFTEEELQKTGVADISQNAKEVLCRYFARAFQGDRFSRMEQAGSLTEEKVALQKVFVDLEVYQENTHTDTDGEMFVSKMVRQGNCENRKITNEEGKEENDYRKYFLTGTAGQGKSTVCQYLVQLYRAAFLKRYLKNGTGEEPNNFLREYGRSFDEEIHCSRIPIHISVKEYAAWVKKQQEKEAFCGVVEYICWQIQKKTSEDFSGKELRELLKTASWIFVFDGMDEVPASSNRSVIIQEIQDFQSSELEMVRCDYMMIYTSRPEGELEGVKIESCCRLRLKEFTPKRCMEYLQRLVEQMGTTDEQKEHFMEVLKESSRDPVVSYLMKSPLQATIVAILVKSGGKPPKDRYDLFETYYRTIKNRERQKDTLESLHDSMDWIDDIQYEIAYKLQKESESDANPSATISEEKFRQLIWEYIDETNGEEDADELCEPFFHVLTKRLCFITDVNMQGEYMFSIRSMQEFLAANEIVRELKVIENLRMIAPSAYWRNVFLFAAGYLQKNVKSGNRDIQDICEELNGKDCTPGQYSMEKIAKAGSWLALDILLEGIYKGAQKVEKVYYDIFFEVKDQASVEKLSECSRLPAEKKDFLRNNYIIPQIQKEPENRVLWHLLCMTSGKTQILEMLEKSTLERKDKLKLLLYLDEKFLIAASGENTINSCIYNLLEEQDTDIDLSYEKCCELLGEKPEMQNPGVKRLIWKNMILHNTKIYRSFGGRDEVSGIPKFWKKMEEILIHCKKGQECLKISDAVIFRITDINRNEENIQTLQTAATWMQEQGFSVEEAFLRMIICPQQQEIQQYIHVLWQESEADREKWLQKHSRQFYIVNWLNRQYNIKSLCDMKENEILQLLDQDFQEERRKLQEAVDKRDWNTFWQCSQLGDITCSPMSKEKLQKYLEETHRSFDTIDQMGEGELGVFLFLAAMLIDVDDIEKPIEEALGRAYKEYVRRETELCWTNIWARQVAIYLMNRQNKYELFSSTDSYKAFQNTENSRYLYRIAAYFSIVPDKLWENVIWMMNAIETDHVIFRVLPALCLCMPTTSLTIPENSYRQLFQIRCKESLRELGRLFFLMLLPDLTDQERELLADMIMKYIENAEKDSILLFLYLMDGYFVQSNLQDMLYEKFYLYLENSDAWKSVEGRKLLAKVCESAYLKVQGKKRMENM